MADSDPISDSTPNKRRKLNSADTGKGWDSQDDSGEEFTAEDFETVATIPVTTTQRKHLGFTKEQLHRNLQTNSSIPYVTQPTQAVTTQATYPLDREDSVPNTSDILVNRSSPVASPQKPIPQPIRKAFAQPMRSMAPPGTAYRAPVGVQQPRPAQIELDDSDNDPPVVHSSDEESTQRTGFRSNLKPTNFQKSSEQIKESPRAAQSDFFKSLVADFNYSSSPARPADDSVSAYGNTSRRPKPQLQPPSQRQGKGPTRPNAVAFETVEDIDDYILRKKVEQIRNTLGYESVQRCMDALARKKDVQDAMDWLLQDEERDASGEEDNIDELASASPAVVKRGIAVSVNTQSSQRHAAKQEAKVPTRTIAEKYDRRPSQPVAKINEPISPEDDVRPRKRLLQGRKLARSPSPPSPAMTEKLPQPRQRLVRKHAVIDIEEDDENENDGLEPIVIAEDDIELSEEPANGHDRRLLKFFNDCTPKDLVDLSAQSSEDIDFLLKHRPFANLDSIREVTALTKTGKQRKGRPLGDRIVDICSEVLSGYDAVDELVDQCERIAQPIQEALKGWGASASGDDGELQLMNLDHAHDSGIGTPASSDTAAVTEEEGQASRRAVKGTFLSQPLNMNAEFTLKDYQLVGLNWLNLLWSKRISCILADDMGLGKTCQVIAFLAHLKQQNVDATHLVIVPGSTLENWLREFERFAPDLRFRPYYGLQAERRQLQFKIEDELDSIDVIVTTYDMAQNKEDNLFLRRLELTTCIYDEAHALRNPKSIRYRSLMRIKAEFRILLTGTPLQNNLQELVAILAFLMPDMFAQKQEELECIFQHKASTTDHKALLSAQRISRARAMVTPFILRRKKHQVLDLPAKNSRVEYCDMSASQATYYRSLIEEFIANKGNAKARGNKLMDLRKAANHPLLARRLYDDKKIEKMLDVLMDNDEYASNGRDKTRDYLTGVHAQSFKGGDFGLHRFCLDERLPYMRKFALKKKPWMDASGKVARFVELVRSFHSNGDRMLVFSQFTTMLDILETVLNTIGIKFKRLDGSTSIQERQEIIDKFTDDDSIPVFMLSTKAGGAGINLACANKVIIFDSGFNPQEDVQAENRAHRVGQTREVEVIRLVTRQTIEEQIYALGLSKLALDERVQGEEADDKQTEKQGEQMVQQMLLESIEKKDEGEEEKESTTPLDKVKKEPGDLKDAFAAGLQNAGVKVASKQAQF